MDLPRFSCQEASYLVFRQAFQEGTKGGYLSDEKKSRLLAAPDILSNEVVRGAIIKMRPHADQWKYLDDIYLSKARALSLEL